ncbi:MAG: valine--tRNA ligase [Candidatus Anstonellales archaeon]
MLEKRFKKEYEAELIKYWEEQKVYQFRGTAAGPIYVIDTPPPFTSGELHMGHALSYAYFDFVARYKRMNGFSVYYPQGWDTQGFPTEVKVEKIHGRKNREEFIKHCVEWTEKHIEIMKNSMKMLGFSPDWNYEYKTYTPWYHKIVQESILEMYKKGLIYRKKHPVYYCTKCYSGLANSDIENVERNGKLYYVKFDGAEIATTRPELIEACVALVVHPSGRNKGLIGKTVKTPYGKEVKVFADDKVDEGFGTGVVMVCTYGDMQDVAWAYKFGLDEIELVGADGRMKEGMHAGLKVKEAREKSIEFLRGSGRLVKEEEVPQTVKIHDRCKTEVEIIRTYQWFAKIKGNEELIERFAKEIKWIPEFGIHYLLDWLYNIDWDWVISRQRWFGTPIPFYVCPACNRVEPASELPFEPPNVPAKVCHCGTKMEPEKSVFDCWVDSSITPLIIKELGKSEKLYPASLRPQGVEIVRTWAFYTIYRCGVLTGKKPFEAILLNGNVLGLDGRKMSKSLGNGILPDELQQKYPADAIRQWAAMSGAMAKDRPFSYEDINYARNFMTKLWNTARFYESFKGHAETSEREPIDEWIESRMNEVVEQVTDAMERMEFQEAIRLIHTFFWGEVADFYLEHIKHRVYGNDEKRKNSALSAFKQVLYTVLKLIAPFAPFMAEKVYLELFGNEGPSVHLAKWPRAGPINKERIKEVGEFNKLVSLCRKEKSSKGIPLGAEVEKLIVKGFKLTDYYKRELVSIVRAKAVEFEEGEKGVEIR